MCERWVEAYEMICSLQVAYRFEHKHYTFRLITCGSDTPSPSGVSDLLGGWQVAEEASYVPGPPLVQS